ncbi:LOC498836 [Phodopus roborovskii]|uniref:LOC498836 protein n=1 Tax=Phodopus roborovskii TaxID=109678 RepID=A0AAU9ZWK1_PHORO|nr:LOC498836 [Phodopus roborovskii]
MDSHRLLDDQPIFDLLPDLLMGVGIGHFVGLIGVQPDCLFTTAEDLEASLFCSLSILIAADTAVKRMSQVSAQIRCPLHIRLLFLALVTEVTRFPQVLCVVNFSSCDIQEGFSS